MQLSQWQTELAKHFDEGAFHILTLDKMGQRIPPAAELMQYDIVLFSRARFEKEISDGCTEVKSLQYISLIYLTLDEG